MSYLYRFFKNILNFDSHLLGQSLSDKNKVILLIIKIINQVIKITSFP